MCAKDKPSGDPRKGWVDPASGPATCLDCDQEFPNVGLWLQHLPDCIPTTANMTPAELDAAYEEAVKRGRS